MRKIIFVCHGNICRSVAAEFIMKKIVKDLHIENDFEISSRAVSYEEIGNDIYPPMKRELLKNNVPFTRHFANRITQKDYDDADEIYYMDDSNRYYLTRMFIDTQNKIKPIYINTSSIRNIEDPWYTDNFELVVNQITLCVKNLI